MSENLFAEDLVKKIVNDIQIWVALIGFIGVVTGSLVTGAMSFFLFYVQNREKDSLDSVRKKLLREALEVKNHSEGRSLQTLQKITGTSDEECRRLLILIGARGFTLKDGREGWCYIKDRPLTGP